MIAHRGDSHRHPENTLEALAAAIAAGAPAVEFDVQYTADGVPVLLHDGTLDRTTARTGAVWAEPWAALAGLTAHEPARLGDRHRHARLPTLAEAVERLTAHPDLEIFLELKAESLSVVGIERGTAKALELAAPLLDRTWVISFVPEAVEAARRLGAHRVGWCLPAYDALHRRRATELAPDLLFVDVLQLDEAPLWPGPWRWAAWEITQGAQARALAERGLDYAETMQVVELLAALDAPRAA